MSLFGAPGSGFQLPSISLTTLNNYFVAKVNVANASTLAGSGSARALSSAVNADPRVVPPWQQNDNLERDDLVRQVMGSGQFVDNRLTGFSRLDAPQDEKRLFALHEGLRRLTALAEAASETGITDFERTRFDRQFQVGFAQVREFLQSVSFDNLTLMPGAKTSTVESQVAIPRASSTYKAGLIHEGPIGDPVEAFVGDVAFNISARKMDGTVIDVAINLNDMGATARTLDNVITHINDQLEGAGVLARFARYKVGEPDEFGFIPGNNFGWELRTLDTERISFSVDPAGQSPAVYLVGASGGVAGVAQEGGQLTKISGLASVDGPAVSASTRVEAFNGGEDSAVRMVASRADGDGNLFTLAQVKGAANAAHLPAGEQDVVLSKYDSRGQLIWQRTLGAANAEGFDLAVNNGRVAIVGALQGDLGDTIDRGERDAFAAVYSGDGEELWMQRLGTIFDDRLDGVALAADGSVVVSGTTKGAMASSGVQAGEDVFVQKFDATGAMVWRSQLGTAGNDRAGGIGLTSTGAVILASSENGEAVLRRLDGTTGAEDTGARLSLGTLATGSVNQLTIDGDDNVYVAGSVGSAGTLTGASNGTAGGPWRDGFVSKISFDPVTDNPQVDFARFIGSAEEDVLNDVRVENGVIYLAGTTDGQMQAGAGREGRAAFVTALSASDGAAQWTQQVAGRAGRASGAGLAIDPVGDSVLDRLGLPRGRAGVSDSEAISERTRARVGDHFFLSVDGGPKKRITLQENQSLRSLAFQIQREMFLVGEARASRLPDGDRLIISPKEGHGIELFAGPDGQDLLGALGMRAGKVENRAKDSDGKEIGPPIYGLNLPTLGRIDDLDKAEAAARALNGAQAVIRRAYRVLIGDDPLAALNQRQEIGPPPAYWSAKIAQYQDALFRLGG